MERLVFYFSLLVAKLSYFALRITKLSSGTAFIGLIVLKICPDFLKYANKYVQTKINITGTNGKTTTSNLTAHILKTSGHKIIYNSTGANMLTGVVNSISLQLYPMKKYEYSVLEADEAHLGKIYKNYDADYLLVTNIFADQLDRYGSIEGTRNLIQQAIVQKPDIQLILNADDPFTACMTAKNKTPIYFGVENVTYSGVNPPQENVDEIFKCACGKNFQYRKKFYSKIGHYFCECGYKRPEVKYSADITIYKDFCEININGDTYRANVMGLFNAYNALAAISLLLEIGIPKEEIQKNLLTYKVFSGRCEYKTLNGHRTLIQLIKNPVGATEVMKTVDLNSNIFIAINDNIADGRDASWINDAKFELLRDAKKEIVVSGIRANEMAQRLEKAGCKKIKVVNNIKEAVKYLATTADGDITMLPNYTALMSVDKTKLLK